MISTPTVLIVGAGGSAPYGYPVGTALRRQIVRNSLMLKPYIIQKIMHESPNLVSGPPVDDAHKSVLEFSKKFHLSSLYSIDAFLERNSQFLEIGKAAIALNLLTCQNAAKLSVDGEWYQYLFNRVATPWVQELKNNQLRILTFNYDISLEYFLRIAIQNAYSCENLSWERVTSIQQECFPINHLYGSLDDNGKYEIDGSVEKIHASAQGIKIISESERASDTPEFQKAHEWISRAEKLVFAGFGFDKSNVERLEINKHFKGSDIFASAHGFEDAQIAEYIFWPMHKMWGAGPKHGLVKSRFKTEWHTTLADSNRALVTRFVSKAPLPKAFDECGMLFD